MVKGTNAQFIFKLPYNYSELEFVKIVFWQDGYNGPADNRPLPIVKVLGQCSQTDKENELSIILNQEETLRFSEDRKGWTQLRGQTFEGIPIATKEKAFTVYPVYDDSILDEEILPTPDYDNLILLDGHTINDW